MSLYDIPVTTIDGAATTLAPYRGQVLLVVNVASRCMMTPQYAGLEALYRKHKDRGFAVLGFPTNDFAEEWGDDAAIRSFCSLKYDVTFPMFSKVHVNGGSAHPLYRQLKAAKPGTLGLTMIKWNFTKFLVARDGTVVQRYGPATPPARVDGEIEKLLTKSEVL